MTTLHFACPQCGGHHFGTSLDTEKNASGGVTKVTITEHQCHDQFKTGCRWRGQWPPAPAAPLRCHPAAADAVLAALVAIDYALTDPDASIASAHMKASRAIAAAQQPILSIDALKENTFTLSIWLGEAMRSAKQRDPVDAVRDAELLLGALKLHLEANR